MHHATVVAELPTTQVSSPLDIGGEQGQGSQAPGAAVTTRQQQHQQRCPHRALCEARRAAHTPCVDPTPTHSNSGTC
jgi:hypothetical protein